MIPPGAAAMGGLGWPKVACFPYPVGSVMTNPSNGGKEPTLGHPRPPIPWITLHSLAERQGGQAGHKTASKFGALAAPAIRSTSPGWCSGPCFCAFLGTLFSSQSDRSDPSRAAWWTSLHGRGRRGAVRGRRPEPHVATGKLGSAAPLPQSL